LRVAVAEKVEPVCTFRNAARQVTTWIVIFEKLTNHNTDMPLQLAIFFFEKKLLQEKIASCLKTEVLFTSLLIT
jgi:hypothetical protein